MEMVTPSMAKMASWLMLLLRGQELGETHTSMMMSSGRWERAKVKQRHYLTKQTYLKKTTLKSALFFTKTVCDW